MPFCKSCNKIAVYGYDEAISCELHRKMEMTIKFDSNEFARMECFDISKKSNICIWKDCTKSASQNFPGLKKRIFCSSHKLDSMINVTRVLCAENNCNTMPNFNYPDLKIGKYCTIHKLEGMVDVINKKCKIDNCNKIPCYNYDGEIIAEYCSKHKLETMIDIKNYKCIHQGCNKLANFNLENMLKPQYCNKHKSDNMVNIKNRKCKFNGCNTIPTFNTIENSIGIYCKEHKLENMVNVVSKKCIEDGCNKNPNFNYEGETSAKYCLIHKKINMININSKRCQYDGCAKIPSFNYKGESTGKYCFIHKLDLMINVICNICEHDGCNIQASYNFENLKPRFCTLHKSLYMINIMNKTCACDGCSKIPNFNYEGNLPAIYCYDHKLDGMIDVKHLKCNTNLCYTRQNPNPQLLGHCTRCFIHLYPESNLFRNFKIKERHTTDFIKYNFSNLSYVIYDGQTGGCSKRRPDVYIDLLTHIIIIEIDENQHKKYETTCEVLKMNQLFEDFGFRPIIFIRFNPDTYINKYKNKIGSCFKIDTQTGILIIDPQKKAEWMSRLDELKNKIQYHINNIPSDNITEYLYYDEI